LRRSGRGVDCSLRDELRNMQRGGLSCAGVMCCCNGICVDGGIDELEARIELHRWEGGVSALVFAVPAEADCPRAVVDYGDRGDAGDMNFLNRQL
jgi:hypothetical protein